MTDCLSPVLIVQTYDSAIVMSMSDCTTFHWVGAVSRLIFLLVKSEWVEEIVALRESGGEMNLKKDGP